MKDECLICGAPLKYLEKDEQMECAVCHKKKIAKPFARTVTTYVTNVIHRVWIAL